MFFRRRPEVALSFEERLETLRESGFAAEEVSGGRVRVCRGASAAIIENRPAKGTRIAVAGRLLGDEIAVLVDAGYQKFWETSGGRYAPAAANQLRELHDFEEDLREALGLESLYNTSLGTTNDLHRYDRLRGR